MTGYNFRPAWTPNGQEIIFTSTGFGSTASLWRVLVSGAKEPEPLAFAQQNADSPAISPKGNRLVYVEGFGDMIDVNIWRLILSGPETAAGPPARFIASTRVGQAAQYSPDGKHIAFESMRSGVYGIWVCDAEGSNFVDLFLQAGFNAGTANWSPDGQRIAFDSNLEGSSDIYVIRSSGGKPIRLTNDPTREDAPSWSRDGKWIYFASWKTDRLETWKVPAAGGGAVQVTSDGGGPTRESPDGRSIYYTKGDYLNTGLWKMPVEGGKEVQVLPSVVMRAFAVVAEGIYFIPQQDADGKSSIQFLSFTTGKVKTVAPVPGVPMEGLSVSPDGRFILFSQSDTGQRSGGDLMLVENFH
jgi:Tol biopolymer transport system component